MALALFLALASLVTSTSIRRTVAQAPRKTILRDLGHGTTVTRFGKIRNGEITRYHDHSTMRMGATSTIDPLPSPPTLDVVVIGLEDVLVPSSSSSNSGLFRGLDFSMRRACMPYYVVTKLAKDEASRRLISAADYLSDFTPESPRLKSGDKVEAIKDILGRMPPNSKLHYVDSDVEILEHVAGKSMDIDLYYAAWASDSESEAEDVLKKGNGKIALIQLDEFAGTMQWGFGLGDQLWDTYLVSNDGAPMEPKGKI
eukprot:jgi/Bigna1/73043/fgenesh1_pg.22_\